MKPPQGPGMGTGVIETGHFLCTCWKPGHSLEALELWVMAGMTLVLTELLKRDRVSDNAEFFKFESGGWGSRGWWGSYGIIWDSNEENGIQIQTQLSSIWIVFV